MIATKMQGCLDGITSRLFLCSVLNKTGRSVSPCVDTPKRVMSMFTALRDIVGNRFIRFEGIWTIIVYFHRIEYNGYKW